MPKPRTAPGPWTVRLEVAPGLEKALESELRSLNIEPKKVDHGGIEMRLDAPSLLRVQVQSRIASRATVRLAKVNAPSLDALAERVRKLPWHTFVHRRQAINVDVSSHKSRLKNRKAVAAKVQHAIQDALKKPGLPGGRTPRVPIRVGVRIVADMATIRIDASGELLHKRGWRVDPGRAPLRENLACAALQLAGWSPDVPLVDPMAGSGTFSVEASLWALGRSPGEHRSFACESWACWNSGIKKPAPKRNDRRPQIWCSDRDERSVMRVQKNARRARVDAALQIAQRSLEELEPPFGPGLVVLNPPWGDRLGDPDHATALHQRWRADLDRRWSQWDILTVVPDERWAQRAWSRQAEKIATFKSGGTEVCLWLRKAVGS